MKYFLKRFMAVLGSTLTLCCSAFGVACGGEGENGGKDVNPSKRYYADSKEQFMIYAYHGPVPASETLNGVDQRTVEGYTTYKNGGFNTLYIQGNEPYPDSSGTFEGSRLKKDLDNAKAAGIAHVIVFDSRIHSLSTNTQPFVGYGKAYPNFQALVDKVKTWISDYKGYGGEGFVIGVSLIDEPTYEQLPQVGTIYKAIKAAWPEAYVQANLLPLDLSVAGGKRYSPDSSDIYVAYEQYLTNFCDYSGADNITMDSYPIRMKLGTNGVSDVTYSITSAHMRCLQIMQKVAKAKGCSIGTVANACQLTKDLEGLDIALKGPNEDEMYWQNNVYMGYGSRQFSYYTYCSKPDGYHTDGTSFVDRNGNTTEMYRYMTRIHEEMQAFAPVILNFEYNTFGYYFNRGTLDFSPSYLTSDAKDENFMKFKVLKTVTVEDNDAAFVTELVDSANNQYMYMLMNPQHPSNSRYSNLDLHAEMEFDSKFKKMEVWTEGKMSIVELNKGKAVFDIKAGHAVFVMPY